MVLLDLLQLSRIPSDLITFPPSFQQFLYLLISKIGELEPRGHLLKRQFSESFIFLSNRTFWEEIVLQRCRTQKAAPIAATTYRCIGCSFKQKENWTGAHLLYWLYNKYIDFIARVNAVICCFVKKEGYCNILFRMSQLKRNSIIANLAFL